MLVPVAPRHTDRRCGAAIAGLLRQPARRWRKAPEQGSGWGTAAAHVTCVKRGVHCRPFSLSVTRRHFCTSDRHHRYRFCLVAMTTIPASVTLAPFFVQNSQWTKTPLNPLFLGLFSFIQPLSKNASGKKYAFNHLILRSFFFCPVFFLSARSRDRHERERERERERDRDRERQDRCVIYPPLTRHGTDALFALSIPTPPGQKHWTKA